MSGNIINFPRKRPRPDTIEMQYDFGNWTIAFYHQQKFYSRIALETKAAAEVEAIRLLKLGMVWRFGANGSVYIFPDSADGGCWAVAHEARSGDSDALLGRFFALELATDTAICAARDMQAQLTLAVLA